MSKEDDYMDFVLKQAECLGKLFILDSGEGNDFLDTDTGWYVEDLSGWLIKPEDKESLLKSIDMGRAYDEYSSSYVFAFWSKSNNSDIEITFNAPPIIP